MTSGRTFGNVRSFGSRGACAVRAAREGGCGRPRSSVAPGARQGPQEQPISPPSDTLERSNAGCGRWSEAHEGRGAEARPMAEGGRALERKTQEGYGRDGGLKQLVVAVRTPGGSEDPEAGGRPESQRNSEANGRAERHEGIWPRERCGPPEGQALKGEPQERQSRPRGCGGPSGGVRPLRGIENPEAAPRGVEAPQRGTPDELNTLKGPNLRRGVDREGASTGGWRRLSVMR
jgi:hypothetical protein